MLACVATVGIRSGATVGLGATDPHGLLEEFPLIPTDSCGPSYRAAYSVAGFSKSDPA